MSRLDRTFLIVGWVIIALPLVSGAQPASVDGYEIKPGDVLNISVWGEQELQADVLVAPDGSISFPLVGHVDARGMTAEQLQQTVAERLATYLSSPVVNVSVAEVNGNKIFVIGQVSRPGEFIMNPAVDIMQALSMAGGTTPFADLDNIRVLRRGQSGQTAIEFRYSDVIRGRGLEQNILLQSGDVVIVP